MDSNPYIQDKKELTEEANEIFQRVWKRVMPDSKESPIVLHPTTRLMSASPSEIANDEIGKDLSVSKQDLEPSQEQNSETLYKLSESDMNLHPIEVLAMDNLSSASSHQDNDFPLRSAVPCLGSQDMQYEKLLQKMIRKELQNWIYYRTLARRVNGSATRIFASMASDKLQNAKRLFAAYFLISGVQFWPERGTIPNITSYLTALRHRFIEEQQDSAYYIAAAAESTDPCLSQLFMEIAEGNLRHAYQIRILVEQI
jgi:rubrerythrin